MRLRVLPNGIMFAPRRGPPPPVPEGYEIYNNDPYIFAPILPECEHREFKQPDSRCCGQAKYLYCNYYGKRVTRTQCVECNSDPS